MMGLGTRCFEPGHSPWRLRNWVAFVKSDATQPTANLEYHVQPGVAGQVRRSTPQSFLPLPRAYATYGRTAAGRFACSADPMVAPRIDPNYLSTDSRPARGRGRAAHDAARISDSPALARIGPLNSCPVLRIQARRSAGGSGGQHWHHHLSSRGHMQDGPAERPMAVVDARLCVRGVTNLRVIDASIMPTSCRATPTRRR